jgi:hypothetical protein
MVKELKYRLEKARQNAELKKSSLNVQVNKQDDKLSRAQHHHQYHNRHNSNRNSNHGRRMDRDEEDFNSHYLKRNFNPTDEYDELYTVSILQSSIFMLMLPINIVLNIETI